MSQFEPQKIMRCLAEGIDPVTMNPIPDESPLQQPYLIRAFFAASIALDAARVREIRKQSLPQNTGKSWTSSEEDELVNGFESGTSLKLLAAEHKRSVTSIRARLVKLGKITEFETIN